MNNEKKYSTARSIYRSLLIASAALSAYVLISECSFQHKEINDAESRERALKSQLEEQAEAYSIER